MLSEASLIIASIVSLALSICWVSHVDSHDISTSGSFLFVSLQSSRPLSALAYKSILKVQSLNESARANLRAQTVEVLEIIADSYEPLPHVLSARLMVKRFALRWYVPANFWDMLLLLCSVQSTPKSGQEKIRKGTCVLRDLFVRFCKLYSITLWWVSRRI